MRPRHSGRAVGSVTLTTVTILPWLKTFFPGVLSQATVVAAVEIFVLFRVQIFFKSSFVCSEKEQVEPTASFFSLFQGSFCDAVRPCADQRLSLDLKLGISLAR